MTTSYVSQTDQNWSALSPEQQDYFRHLSANTPHSAVQFFERTVPVELQDNPEALEVWLNGGTVTTTEWDYTRGRAGGEYVTVEHEVPDRDWSHDVSVANGGSDSPDNGRFEDASVNRARGSANSTATEQAAADAEGDYHARLLTGDDVVSVETTDGELVTVTPEEASPTLVQHLDDVGEATAWATGAEVAGGFLEAAFDGLLPVVGGAVVAKKVYDHFDDPVDKVGYSAALGGATVAALLTPPGQLAVGGWVVWKLGQRGVKLWNKHVVA